MYHDLEKKFYSYDEIKDSGLPIVDYYFDEESCEDSKLTWFTYTDFKKLLDIYLTDDERRTAVEAFEKVPNGRGYVPLYCFETVLKKRKKGK